MSTMRFCRSALAAAMIIFIPISCTKNSPTENNNEAVRVNRIYHPQTPLIPDSEFAIVQTLFRQNNLDLSNLQIYSFQTDQGGYYVKGSQFFLGLEFFTNDLTFVFDPFGTLTSSSGGRVGSFPLDTMPTVAMRDAGTLFDSIIAADARTKTL